MGIGKFVLPLLFPLVFKYVVDVLLVPQPRLESVNLTLDRSSIALAKLMGSFPVIVPPAPGLLCAIGDLVADFRDEFAQTYIRLVADASFNVEYAYGSAPEGGAMAAVVLGVDDAQRAAAAAGV